MGKWLCGPFIMCIDADVLDVIKYLGKFDAVYFSNIYLKKILLFNQNVPSPFAKTELLSHVSLHPIFTDTPDWCQLWKRAENITEHMF